jgi:isoquinoline 1-oxidoreductase beta subunit
LGCFATIAQAVKISNFKEPASHKNRYIMATHTRREFLRLSALSTGAVLAIGFLPASANEIEIINLAANATPGTPLNAYIFIDRAGKITIYNHRPEMGQGTFQSMPMIIAEELEADIKNVTIAASPADRSKYGDQNVVGSRSTQSQFEPMRKVGAAAKAMLIQAAATRWQAEISDCFAENAVVVHRPSGKKLNYGELVEEASKLTPPQNPVLKSPKDFKVIGQSLPRQDIPFKTNGSAKYGIDFSVPGMLYASVERSPVFLGKVISFNDAKAKAVPGVKHIFKTQRNVWGNNREGVAVLADNYWAAEQGRKALEIEWDNGDYESWSTEKIKQHYKAGALKDGVALVSQGNFDPAYTMATTKVEAVYETPYQAHSCMEPMNALVYVQEDRCEYWGSTQNPNGIRSQLARQCNLPEEKVYINYTFMGGGFGRRSMTDMAEEAADLSIKAKTPVKVIWTREDDISQGPFRACSLNVCKGGLDDNGKLSALEHKIICQDIRNQTGNNEEASGGIMGGIHRAYSIPNFRVSGVLRKLYIPITYWRSVYHSTNCFAHESFIDELAHAAKKDPVDFRLAMLKDHRRFYQVVKVAAEKTDWYKPRAKNTGKGISMVERSGSFVAMVIEVAAVNKKVAIKKITAVVDAGIVVNPDTVKAQAEGSIVMGLTAAFKSSINIEKGKVAEKNFHTYKMLLLPECPEIEIIILPSEDAPEGAGEAGLPNVAPALANAIFDMTGKRPRSLPMSLDI